MLLSIECYAGRQFNNDNKGYKHRQSMQAMQTNMVRDDCFINVGEPRGDPA